MGGWWWWWCNALCVQYASRCNMQCKQMQYAMQADASRCNMQCKQMQYAMQHRKCHVRDMLAMQDANACCHCLWPLHIANAYCMLLIAMPCCDGSCMQVQLYQVASASLCRSPQPASAPSAIVQPTMAPKRCTSKQAAKPGEASMESKEWGCRIKKMLGKLKYIRDHAKKTTEDEKKDCFLACMHLHICICLFACIHMHMHLPHALAHALASCTCPLASSSCACTFTCTCTCSSRKRMLPSPSTSR